jgi:hypothetical protein
MAQSFFPNEWDLGSRPSPKRKDHLSAYWLDIFRVNHSLCTVLRCRLFLLSMALTHRSLQTAGSPNMSASRVGGGSYPTHVSVNAELSPLRARSVYHIASSFHPLSIIAQALDLRRKMAAKESKTVQRVQPSQPPALRPSGSRRLSSFFRTLDNDDQLRPRRRDFSIPSNLVL